MFLRTRSSVRIGKDKEPDAIVLPTLGGAPFCGPNLWNDGTAVTTPTGATRSVSCKFDSWKARGSPAAGCGKERERDFAIVIVEVHSNQPGGKEEGCSEGEE